MSCFLLEVLLLEAAKILTISTLGGSHYMVMSRVSQILHGGGHNVTKLLYDNDHIPDCRKEKPSYKLINWHLPEDQQEKFDNCLCLLVEELGHGRYKSAAMASKIIRHSHPLTPAQRLVGWIDHILQTGGCSTYQALCFPATMD